MIVDGKKLASIKQLVLKKKLTKLRKENRSPRLISLVAKEDKEGLLYTKIKQKKAQKLGIKFKKHIFSLADKDKIFSLIKSIVKTSKFDGLIIQKPNQNLAKKYFQSKKDFSIWWLSATSLIPEKKDVDCLNVANLGLFSAGLIQFYPATVKAIYQILLSILKEKDLAGKNVVILGSSEILGKPLSMLLRNKGATVTICGSATKNLKNICRQAEVIITCVGKNKLITANMVKKEAIVIDAGIVKVGKKVQGDVDFEPVSKKAAYLTPVPGGVGPMTVISLMENVTKAYRQKPK